MFSSNKRLLSELREDSKSWKADQIYSVMVLAAWVDGMREIVGKLLQDKGMSEEESEEHLRELFEKYWEAGLENMRETAPDLVEMLEERHEQHNR